MEITYQEGALLLPYSRDYYAVHQRVYDACIGKTTEKIPRTFVFNVKPIIIHGTRKLFVMTRSQHTLSGPIKTYQKKINLVAGQVFSATIQLYKEQTHKHLRHRVENKTWFKLECKKGRVKDIGNGYVRAINDESRQMNTLIKVIENKGFLIDKIDINRQYRINIGRSRTENINVYDVQLDTVIVDEQKVQKAWLQGIGDARGFGCGMLIAGAKT